VTQRTASTREHFVRCEKRHRYVSRCGPTAQSSGKTIAQALAVAENEGWPIAIHARLRVVNGALAVLASSHPRAERSR
jgi:hypothetical protein